MSCAIKGFSLRAATVAPSIVLCVDRGRLFTNRPIGLDGIGENFMCAKRHKVIFSDANSEPHLGNGETAIRLIVPFEAE